MFNAQDLVQMEVMGTTAERVAAQIEVFKKGVPFTPLVRACTVGDGIVRLEKSSREELINGFETARAAGRITKFVPASGAASRMFKSLHTARENLAAGRDVNDEAVDHFFHHLADFAFAPEIEEHLAAAGKTREDKHAVLNALLDENAMNYGNLPKGLLSFHRYPQGVRTPVEEHLSEAESMAVDAHGRARLHFTVSPEHMSGFKAHVSTAVSPFEARGMTTQVDFSIQKESTNTIAVTPENAPFRDHDGQLLFRPGGHGALIENLNDLKGDLIFIKNVDNVVPDHLKQDTIVYKKALGGLLVRIQERIFTYLRRLDEGSPDEALIAEITQFARENLGFSPPDRESAAAETLYQLLNRPVRVCGMVKNEGEPGGGPFWVQSPKGTSIQIVESGQIDPNAEDQAAIVAGATHFNPVDLVCGVRDYRGNNFDLSAYVDPEACFISDKSFAGRPLKALELPGLWNGAMAFWNTCFVEVPLSTFNPVKTVNDLLREQHR